MKFSKEVNQYLTRNRLNRGSYEYYCKTHDINPTLINVMNWHDYKNEHFRVLTVLKKDCREKQLSFNALQSFIKNHNLDYEDDIVMKYAVKYNKGYRLTYYNSVRRFLSSTTTTLASFSKWRLRHGESNTIESAKSYIETRKNQKEKIKSIKDLCENYELNKESFRAWCKAKNIPYEASTVHEYNKYMKMRQEGKLFLSYNCNTNGVSYFSFYTWCKKYNKPRTLKTLNKYIEFRNKKHKHS